MDHKKGHVWPIKNKSERTKCLPFVTVDWLLQYLAANLFRDFCFLALLKRDYENIDFWWALIPAFKGFPILQGFLHLKVQVWDSLLENQLLVADFRWNTIQISFHTLRREKWICARESIAAQGAVPLRAPPCFSVVSSHFFQCSSLQRVIAFPDAAAMPFTTGLWGQSVPFQLWRGDVKIMKMFKVRFQ